MYRTITDVIYDHRCGINAQECDAPGCDWVPNRNRGDWRRQHAEHVSAMLAGLSRVLTGPERAALDRLREYADGSPPYGTRDAARTLVAFVERLAAAPAPEALVDAACTTMGCENLGTVTGVFEDDGYRERVTYCASCASDLAGQFTPDAVLATVGQAPLPPEAYEVAEAWMRDRVAALETSGREGQAAAHDTETDACVLEDAARLVEARRPQIPPSTDPKRRQRVIERSTLKRAAASIRALAASRAAAADSGEER